MPGSGRCGTGCPSRSGESGKRFGNETIRVTPDGEVSIKLPVPLAHLANARPGRYVLASTVAFAHRGAEWADRIEANRALAYRIHLDTERGRWYLTASWQRPAVTIPLETARARGMVGVDTNADHFAAYRLDRHGNPIGGPRRFFYDLSGTADHRDAQIRHALTRLINWARCAGVAAIGIEDLDFATEKTREKHREDPGEARGPQAVPAAHLRHAHRQAQGPAGVDGRRTGLEYCRGRPGLHQPVGCAALAEAAGHPTSKDVPSRCRRYRDRETRPRTPGPGWGLPCSNGVESLGKDGTAPTRPERSCRASDHPGRTRPPTHNGPAPRRAVAEREAKAGTQRIQHRSGCAQHAPVGPGLTYVLWLGTVWCPSSGGGSQSARSRSARSAVQWRLSAVLS